MHLPRPLVVALFATTCGSTAFAAEPLTAEQFAQRVLGEGPGARVAEAEAALARAEAVGVGRWPNPSLEWQRESIGGGPNSAQDSFVASIPLVLSGRLGLEADAARSRAEAGRLRLIRARAVLHREALDRYHQAAASAQRRATFAQSLEATDQLLRVITTRQKAGEASGYDLLRVTVERAALDSAALGAALERQQAVGEAMALLPSGAAAIAFEGPLSPPASGAPATLDANRADLKALVLDAQAGDEDARAAARAWIPEPVLSGGAQLVGVGQPGAGAGYVIGVSLPVPIFQHRSGERAQGLARKELAEQRRSLALRRAELDLDRAQNEVAARALRLARHEADVLPRAIQLREVAAAAYRGGAAELLVLVDAERLARDARLTQIELQLQLRLAHDGLRFLAGDFDR